MRVCLLGSGSLALGLLYPWLSRIPSVELSLLRRARSTGSGAIDFGNALKRSRSYRLVRPGQETTETIRSEILEYDPDDLATAGSRECIDRLERADVVAVSVTVPALPSVAPLLSRACHDPCHSPLHVLAFENAPDASRDLCRWIHRQVERSLGSGAPYRPLIAHAAIPDRACARRIDGEDLVITIERFGEIVLERSAAEVFGNDWEPMDTLPRVRYVAPQAISIGEKRKFWLVNGTHTALGVLCAASNRHLLSDATADHRVTAFIRQLHAEWVRVLHRIATAQGLAGEIFSESELAAHAERLFERLADQPEFSVRDVLKELTLPPEREKVLPVLARLLHKLDDRLGCQVREAFANGGVPVPISGNVLATSVHVAREHVDRYLND